MWAVSYTHLDVYKRQVLEINEGNALVQLFESSTGINLSNSRVRFLGRTMELGVSEDMLGRIFDGLGRPIDDGPEILPDRRDDINGCLLYTSKRPDQFGKAMIFPAMVETYAVLALLVSLLAVANIGGIAI